MSMSENDALGKATDSSTDADNNPSECRECGVKLGAGYLCDGQKSRDAAMGDVE